MFLSTGFLVCVCGYSHHHHHHHHHRYGYKDIHELKSVIQGYAQAKLPLDTLWSDIDHMDSRKDFTFDPVNYPVKAMADLVNDLHANKQQWVPIVDPAIKVERGYDAYERGCEDKVWMLDAVGNPLLGRMWPGVTHWPDFMHEKTKGWWERQLKEYHKQVAFDGIWLVGGGRGMGHHDGGGMVNTIIMIADSRYFNLSPHRYDTHTGYE